MLISGLNKTTLLDYPGRVAATVFTGGCNFRCPFCHNAGLVLRPLSQESYTEEEVLAFLRKRRGILTGVCITGGEPTIQQDLPDFVRRIKELGLQVKLDTNGSHPQMLAELIKEGLLDYVAMDIKNSPQRYLQTIGYASSPADHSGRSASSQKEQIVEGVSQDKEKAASPARSDDGRAAGQGMGMLEVVRSSVALLKEAGIAYEFRTTVVRELHTREDLEEICQWIEGCPAYYLQKFEDSGELIGEQCGYHGYTDAEMKELAGCLNAESMMAGRVHVRGLA